MRIVQIGGGHVKIPADSGGGVETFLFNLSKKLSQLGHDVTLVDRKYTPSDPATECVDGVDIVRLKSARVNRLGFTVNFVISQIFFTFRVKKYLATLSKYDIIHIHYSILGVVLSIINKGIRQKLVYTSHALRRDKISSSLTDRIVLLLENYLIKRVSKMIVLSEVNKTKVITQTGVNSQDIFLVPIGVDVEQYNPDLEVGDVKQRYNFHGKTNILFVGRICYGKGVEYLVKAADILVNGQGYTGVQFLLVGPAAQFDPKNSGKSPYISRIIGLIETTGLRDVIRMTGVVPVDDLRKLYAACDLVLVPSIVDLDPQVLLEAMAVGKPVIGTRVGSIPRRIADGQSGFIIDPGNEKQLAEKIEYFLDNPERMKNMGTYARELVSREYSSGKMAERMLEVYRSLE